MRPAIATLCPSGTLDERLPAVVGRASRPSRSSESDPVSLDVTPRDVRALASDLGLDVAVSRPFRDFEGVPEPPRAEVFARAERRFDTMRGSAATSWWPARTFRRRARAVNAPIRLAAQTCLTPRWGMPRLAGEA